MRSRYFHPWRRRGYLAITAGIGLLVAGISACGSSSGSGASGASGGVQMIVAMPGTGESFDNAVSAVLFKDFENQTGNSITLENDSSLPTTLAAQEQAHNVNIDVMLYATYGDYLQAQKQGYLQKLNTSVIPVSQLDPKTVTPYGIQAWAYATLLGYNTHALDGKKPQNLEDIFNTKTYPGKRCLYKYPEYGGVLESALLASGVSPSKLYPLNVPLAFKKLDTLKNNVIWWTTGAQAEQNLASGGCSMALYYSADLYTMAKVEHDPVGLAWGHAIMETPVLAIPKDAPHLKAAEELLRSLIINKAGQQKMMTTLPYSTVTFRDGAANTADKQIAAWLPAGANLRTAIYANDTYYAANINQLVQKFDSWLLTQ